MYNKTFEQAIPNADDRMCAEMGLYILRVVHAESYLNYDPFDARLVIIMEIMFEDIRGCHHVTKFEGCIIEHEINVTPLLKARFYPKQLHSQELFDLCDNMSELNVFGSAMAIDCHFPFDAETPDDVMANLVSNTMCKFNLERIMCGFTENGVEIHPSEGHIKLWGHMNGDGHMVKTAFNGKMSQLVKLADSIDVR